MLHKALKLAIDQVGSQLSRKGLELQLDLPDDLPAVRVDSDSLRQIAVTLIENAIAVSPAKSTVAIAARADDPDWVTLSVRDSGSGVPAEDLGRTFQPQLLTEGELVRIRQLAESSGGRVWIESELGAGSTVMVQLPVLEGSGDSAA